MESVGERIVRLKKERNAVILAHNYCLPEVQDMADFVGDSLAGNAAIEQAKVFDAAVGIDAVILTKIDTDAKGGAALSIAHTIGKPIAFVCNGQEYGDIIKFNTEWMIDRMFNDE